MTHLASYIQALFFAALFLTFINGDIGWAMVYIIGGIALLSSVMLFKNKNGKIRAIYLRTRRLVCLINGSEPESTAAGEVCAAAGRSLGLDKEAREITESADLLLYGGKTSEISAKQLYRDYRIIRKTKRKMKK